MEQIVIYLLMVQKLLNLKQKILKLSMVLLSMVLVHGVRSILWKRMG